MFLIGYRTDRHEVYAKRRLPGNRSLWKMPILCRLFLLHCYVVNQSFALSHYTLVRCCAVVFILWYYVAPRDCLEPVKVAITHVSNGLERLEYARQSAMGR
jgi:hypothetical protein